MTIISPTKPVSVTAETQIVNQNGDLETFDSFVDRDIRFVDTLSISENKKFTSSYVKDFSGRLDTETATTVKLTFASGETLECLRGSKVLSSSTQWVPVETLKEGSAVNAVVYNPSHRNPQKTLKKISRVEILSTPMIAAIEFTMEVEDNLLIAIEGENTFILLPIRPVLL